MSDNLWTRREAACLPLAATLAAAPVKLDPALLERHEELVRNYLARQITGAASPHMGGIPDEFGIVAAGSATGPIEAFTAAFVCPQSKYHQSKELLGRTLLAAAFLTRSQHADGTIDLPSTNFHSPPDTGFVVHGVANAALLARRSGVREIDEALAPFLKKAGGALAVGGIHTPNHRWVVCEALAQIDELYPDPRHTARIAQWLAEGIDIDEEGQYTERSTTIYNGVVNRALVVTAIKTGRPELLDPVRRNLDAMQWLLQPNGELVTEISRRQDLNTAGDGGRSWFALQYLAARDGNGTYASMASMYEPKYASLPLTLIYPELQAPLASLTPLPDDFEKIMPGLGIARIRRGPASTTILFNGSSKLLTFRNGDAVVAGVRFASAFFGKGQFAPLSMKRSEGAFVLPQELAGPYFQPVAPSRVLRPSDMGASRAERAQSEVQRMRYEAVARESPKGVSLELIAEGTDNVPVAVEINLRPGGTLTGAEPLMAIPEAYLLRGGYANYRVGSSAVRFGPGLADHSWTQIRGAEPKLPGPSVYLCGFTPFRRTIQIERG